MSDASSPSQPDAGWYLDPSVPGQLRYWIDNAWTEHTQADPSAAVAPVLSAPPSTRPVSFELPPVVSEAGADPAVIGGRRAQRLLEEVPSRRRLLLPAAVGGLVLVVALGFWLIKGTSADPPVTATAASPVVSTVETPQAFQTGASYIETSLTPGDPGALPTCAASSASWVQVQGGKVVTTVMVQGPKSVGVVLIDKAHPERPNASHQAVQVKAGEKSATFAIELPPGGLERVQVSIQADQGIQRCDALKAA